MRQKRILQTKVLHSTRQWSNNGSLEGQSESVCVCMGGGGGD